MPTFSRTSPEISSGISASDLIGFFHAPSCSVKSSGIFCVSLTRITAIGVNSEAAVSIERSPLARKKPCSSTAKLVQISSALSR